MTIASDVSPVAGRRHDLPRAGNSTYFANLCGLLLLLNLSTALFHFTGVSALKEVTNAVGIAAILYSLFVVFRSPYRDGIGTGFLVYASLGTTLSVLFNWAETSAIDVLKYIAIYIFFAAGRASIGRVHSLEMWCIYCLAALPIAFLLLGNSKVYGPESFSYLPNANTAVLFFGALLFAASETHGNRVIWLQFVNAILMNKIGAVIATVAAIALWIVFPLRKESVVAMGGVVVAVVLAISFGALDRVTSVLDNMALVYGMNAGAVAGMSYRELVQLTGSTDLSGFFRLFHWSNIMDIYSSRGLGGIILGYGAGQTPALTYAGLVPHNDYLRVLAEYGILNLFIFVTFLLTILFSLRLGAARVLFMVLCAYFFSENLLDNFTSMAVYFAYAGRMSVVSLSPRLVRHLHDGRRSTAPG